MITSAERFGLPTTVSMIIGFPEETEADLRASVDMFMHSMRQPHSEPQMNVLAPLSGTPLYAQYIAEKELPWGVWPATYFDGWPHEEITGFLKESYRKFYLMPKRFEMRQFLFRLSNLPHKLSYFASVN